MGKKSFTTSKLSGESTVEAIQKETDLEIEISDAISEIEKANDDARKLKLEKFISYAKRIDGAASEIYCNFAFEYEQQKPIEFYSVLQEKDTVLLTVWAGAASLEAVLVMDNIKDGAEFYNRLKTLKRKEITTLSETQQQLAAYYHKNLIENVDKAFQKE